MQSGRGNCTHTYVVMHMRGRGRRVDELVAKIRTVKISSGTSGGIFAKVCTSENFPLYGIIRVSYLQSLYSIVVHGYVVHSVLASYNIIVHVVCTCKQEGGRNCVIL